MRKPRLFRTAVPLALLLVPTLPNARASATKLRDVVYKVETQYDDRTRTMLLEWSKLMREMGSEDGAQMFESLAHNGGGGTGWLYRDRSHTYVITNAHVVAGASSVNLYKRDDFDKFRKIDNCEITYVDFDHDLAIITPPSNHHMAEHGLEIVRHDLKTNKTVYAAGFPGDLGEQSWTLSAGSVVNPHVTALQAFREEKRQFEFLIEHSAEINHGNSGGPLLIAKHRNASGEVDEDDASNFQVVGVNVAIAGKFNFSIPVEDVLRAISASKKAGIVMSSAQSRETALEEESKALAAELGRVRTSDQDVDDAIERLPSFMSNAYVGRYGNGTLIAMVKSSKDENQKENLLKSFLHDPVSMLDKLARLHFVLKLMTLGDLSGIRFAEVNYADRRDLMNRSEVTTSFFINDRKQDINWKIEYGRWRVSDLKVVSHPDPVPSPVPRKTGEEQQEPEKPALEPVASWLEELRRITGGPR